MLRLIFVSVLLIFGAAQALRGPFYALLFYLAYAYFRPESWIWGSELQGQNFSFVIGAWAILATVVSSREHIAKTFFTLLLVVLCLHALLSTLAGDYVEWSFSWWKNFAKVTSVTILIISLVNTRDRFRLTLYVIAGALGMEAVKQGWLHMLLNPGQPNTNPIDVLGDNNAVAVGTLMVAAALLPLFQTSSSLVKKAGLGFLILGYLFRAVTTYSRGGMLAFVAMIAVYWTRSTKKLGLALLLAVTAIVSVQFLPEAYWERMQSIFASSAERDNAAEGRVFFWKVATKMANDHPFLGVGTNGYEPNYDRYDPTKGAFGQGRAVHSIWFGILAEQGYVGLILFVVILLSALVACSRVRKLTKRKPDSQDLYGFAGGMQAALIGAIVGGTFLSFHYVEILWHFIGLTFALYGIASREALPAESTAPETSAAVLNPVSVTVPERFIARSRL